MRPIRRQSQATKTKAAASDLAAAREKLLARGPSELDSAALREAWGELHEFWLTTKATEIGITAGSGFAIVATGSLGRRELVPYSDLDLMLLHDDKPTDEVREVADSLWYPLWDANIRLDHSVRTVPQTLKVASADVSACMAMLDARHIAGDQDSRIGSSRGSVGNGAPKSSRCSANSSRRPTPAGAAAVRSRTAPSLI